MGWILIILMVGVTIGEVVEFIHALLEADNRPITKAIWLSLCVLAAIAIFLFTPDRMPPNDSFGPVGGLSAAEQKSLIEWE